MGTPRLRVNKSHSGNARRPPWLFRDKVPAEVKRRDKERRAEVKARAKANAAASRAIDAAMRKLGDIRRAVDETTKAPKYVGHEAQMNQLKRKHGKIYKAYMQAITNRTKGV